MYFVQQAQKSPRAIATPVSGAKQIIDKLAAVVERNGEIKKGCRVDQIMVKDGGVVGVRAGRKMFTSNAVVYAPPVYQPAASSAPCQE